MASASAEAPTVDVLTVVPVVDVNAEIDRRLTSSRVPIHKLVSSTFGYIQKFFHDGKRVFYFIFNSREGLLEFLTTDKEGIPIDLSAKTWSEFDADTTKMKIKFSPTNRRIIRDIRGGHHHRYLAVIMSLDFGIHGVAGLVMPK